MQTHTLPQVELPPQTRDFYSRALKTLKAADVSFLIGGAYAFEHYTGIARHTKDLDLFVRAEDCDRVFTVLSKIECDTQLPSPHWLGKAHYGEDFLDIIFNSPNGTTPVDETWFEQGVAARLFDVPVQLCSPEDMIWSKAFVMSRDRYDGADVAHLLLKRSQFLDWSHLLDRFDDDWRVLLSHLILFGFIYPAERSQIPDWVMQNLMQRLQRELETPPDAERLCQGTLLSGLQYRPDVEQWGYTDIRLQPQGSLTAQEILDWTAALERHE